MVCGQQELLNVDARDLPAQAVHQRPHVVQLAVDQAHPVILAVRNDVASTSEHIDVLLRIDAEVIVPATLLGHAAICQRIQFQAHDLVSGLGELRQDIVLVCLDGVVGLGAAVRDAQDLHRYGKNKCVWEGVGFEWKVRKASMLAEPQTEHQINNTERRDGNSRSKRGN